MKQSFQINISVIMYLKLYNIKIEWLFGLEFFSVAMHFLKLTPAKRTLSYHIRAPQSHHRYDSLSFTLISCL